MLPRVAGILERTHVAADARRVALNTVSTATALNDRVRRNTYEVARVGVMSALDCKKSFETALLKTAAQLAPGKYRAYIKNDFNPDTGIAHRPVINKHITLNIPAKVGPGSRIEDMREGSIESYKDFMDDYTEAVATAIISYVQVGSSGSGATSVHTVAIPSGGGAATEGRTVPEIFNNKSVVEIKAKDNGCCWRSLAVLIMGSKDGNTKTRESAQEQAAKYLCSQTPYVWGERVAVDDIPNIEQSSNVSVNILDLDNLPLLNTTGYIHESMIYKYAHDKGKLTCWLLFW